MMAYRIQKKVLSDIVLWILPMRSGLFPCSRIRYSQVVEPIVVNLNVNSRRNEGAPERTKAGERHRIKEEMKERLVGKGAR